MKTIKCEMAGTVIEIKAKVGDQVKPGQEIAVIESMKMEVPVVSKVSGTVSKVLKSAGDFLNDGEVLLELS